MNEAYDVLRDDEKKKAYDLALQQFIKYGSQTEYDRAIKAYEYFKKQKTNHVYGSFVNNTDNYQSNYKGTVKSQTSQSSVSQQSKNGNSGCLIWIILLALFLIWASIDWDSIGSSSSGKQSSTPYSQSQSYTPISVYNGQMFKTPSGECPCKITIKTSSGSDYYVYMDDMYGNNDLAFYVVGGNTVTKNIPLGTYKLYYCSGSTWYGVNYKFGDNTVACTSDQLFEFTSSISGDYIYYDTWEVTLYKVSNGNMSTQTIPMSNFPN